MLINKTELELSKLKAYRNDLLIYQTVRDALVLIALMIC